jgi:hypothetical protein
LVVWLLALLASDTGSHWLHLLLPLAFGILAISFWNDRSPRSDA